ncbi:MAG: leucine-rich repeat domain-containing protein, partial [Planctomycetota bacterium]
MWHRRTMFLIVMLLPTIFVRLCEGAMDDVVSGRELLRALREKDKQVTQRADNTSVMQRKDAQPNEPGDDIDLGKDAPIVKDKEVVEARSRPRVLHFPRDRSLGRIVIRDADTNGQPQTFREVGNSWSLHAEYLGEAQGDVVIDAGKRVGLFVNEPAGRDLSALTRLKPNDLYFLMLPSSANSSSMRYVTKLTGLRVLYLARNITDSGMRNISELKSLERLTLSEKIGNAGLRQIAKLPSLRGLYFQQTKITDEGLAMLSGLSTLEELTLYGRHIGDAGLVHVTKLPSLRFLILAGENFSDAGLVHLKDVPSLKILN